MFLHICGKEKSIHMKEKGGRVFGRASSEKNVGEEKKEGKEGRKGFWEMSYTDRAPPPPLMEKGGDEEKESF